jgi:dTDP-4-dehydrorhamnose 3,5-epimerase
LPFRFTRLEIPDVILVEAVAFEDRRGVFLESYKRSEFAANGIADVFVQDNFSRSVKGVLRGLHYQLPPCDQGKLVGVLRGEIFDVAVDIRKGSPWYGRWVGLTLSALSCRLRPATLFGAGQAGKVPQMIYIPAGFAHGFCVLSDEADVLYKTTAEYAKEWDRGIRWDDKDLDIRWPIRAPIVSDKDAQLPPLREVETGFVYEL